MFARKIAISFQSSAIRLIISIILLFTFASPAFAQAPLPSNVSPTSPLYTDLLVHNIFHTFSCLAVGQSVISQPCLNYVQGIPVLSSVNLSGGALGATTSLIGMLFANPPVRTTDYLATVGQSLGIVKDAHAQGVVGSGAGVLSPIISLWQVSRNIAYLLMIVIFVVIGLMIIFRQKINPQTVITAQAALPGLVIGLILITFSYFLAGLISDTAFLGTNIVGAYFSAVKGPGTTPQNLVADLSPHSVLDIFSPFLGIVTDNDASSALDAIFSKITDIGVQAKLRLLAGFLGAQFVAPLAGAVPVSLGPWALIAGPAITLISGSLVGVFPSFFLGFTLSFVATLALVYQMLQLLLRLVRCYLTVVFLVITAPFQFLFSSLPGRQGLATDWIMNMLGNVLVFPAVIAVVYFVVFLTGHNAGPLTVSGLNQTPNGDFVPSVYAQGKIDVVGDTTFPLFGGLNLGFIKILLAFGALMALPAIPDIVVKTIGKVGQAGQLIGQEISGGMKSGQGYSSQFQSGVSGTTGQLKRGIMGDTNYVWQNGKLVPHYGTPGAIHIGRVSKTTPIGSAGTGRTVS